MSWELSVHGTYNHNHFFKTLYDFFEYYLSFCIEWYGDTNLKFSAPQNRRCGELLDLGMSFRYDRGSLEYSSITF